MKTIDYDVARLMVRKIILSCNDINALCEEANVTRQAIKLILRDNYVTLLPKPVFNILKLKHPSVRAKRTYTFSFSDTEDMEEIFITNK